MSIPDKVVALTSLPAPLRTAALAAMNDKDKAAVLVAMTPGERNAALAAMRPNERAAVLALYLQAAVAACAATAEPADADRCADELCAFLGVGQDAARALEPATPPRARDLSISSSPRSSVSATPPRPASLNDLTAATPTPPAAKVVAPAVSAAAPASAERCGWRCLRCVQT